MARSSTSAFALGLCAAGLALAGSVQAGWAAEDGETAFGEALYTAHCAACHGQNGEGSGPVAGFLTVSPANLTKIAERNGGQFPFLKVFHIIDGRTETRGHGTVQMPVWGSAFSDEELGFGDSAGGYGSEPLVRARITALTFYIESIQK